MDAMVRPMVLTNLQIRAARAMLGLTQAELASQAGLSKTGLNNIESGRADAKGSTLQRLQAALEAQGIEFNADGRGVRLRMP
jgi:transcriptional regulator with XRE-family HTH domain